MKYHHKTCVLNKSQSVYFFISHFIQEYFSVTNVEKTLGSGGFGEVFKGTYKGIINVAVKKLNTSSKTELDKIYESFKKELDILV